MLRKYTASYLRMVRKISLQNLVLKISGKEGITKIYVCIYTVTCTWGLGHLKYKEIN